MSSDTYINTTHKGVTRTMEIDNIKLKQYYKDIQKTCIQKGELLPLLIDRPINSNTHLTMEEIESIRKEIPETLLEEQDNSRQEQYKTRQNDLYLMRIDRKQEDIQEYMENELQAFIDKYPQYKDIIID